MLKRTPQISFFLTALLMSGAIASAQQDLSGGPPMISPDGNEPDIYQPLIDLDTYHQDYQFFAPIELNSLSERPDPNTGFYATYDRTYLSLSRPDSSARFVRSRPFEGDYIWGNRINIGYMTEDDHGWDLTYMHSQGGFESDSQRITGSNFHSIGLNKTVRQSFHYGAYVEYYMGARYIYFRDNHVDTSSINVVDDMDMVIGTVDSEFLQTARNLIMTGQIGARFVKQKGHLTLSADGRIVFGQNFQSLSVSDASISIDTTTTPDTTTIGEFSQSLTSDEFVPMGEFRLEAAYQVSRDFSLRAGLELMVYGNGINRVDTDVVETNPNAPSNLAFGQALSILGAQDMVMAGVSFGFVWNR